MPSPCNVSVTWVTWEVKDGPPEVRWSPPQVLEGTPPQKPDGKDPQGKAMVKKKANEEAQKWSEVEPSCPDQKCASGPETSTEFEIVIPTYATPVEIADIVPQPWKAMYQASGNVTFKKIRHTKECRPEVAGEMISMGREQGKSVVV